jgi:hypothetical protein
VALEAVPQAGDETLRSAMRADVTKPDACTRSGYPPLSGAGAIQLFVDGKEAGALSFQVAAAGATSAQVDLPDGIQVEDGAAHSRALDLRLSDDCTEADKGFTFTNVHVVIQKSH